MNDKYYIEKCLNGDKIAFDFLVNKYRASIYSLSYSKTRNFHDAEDITQEVFAKAYKNLSDLKIKDKFSSWLYVITTNTCKNFFRDKSNRLDNRYIEDQSSKELYSTAVYRYREALMQEFIQEALDSLSEISSQVLMLRYIGGMNSIQIAEFLNISPVAVRKRLSRARVQLTEEFFRIMNNNIYNWIPYSCIPDARTGIWSIKDGILHYSGTKQRSISYLTLGDNSWRDYTITCNARMLKPMWKFSRIIFGVRMTEMPRNEHVYYVMGPTPWGDSAGIGVFQNNGGSNENWEVIKFEMEKWYRLKAEVIGCKHRFFINDNLVVEHEIQKYKSGRLGIGCACAEIELENAQIELMDEKYSDIGHKPIPITGRFFSSWGKIRRK
ncbi:sigma-70 family RNA polymerase sigma factor [Candidatus Poribacteria bacterium]|nr:sigma-70 family RNA polymerase sigma factor [Candidatus Poribacteria bacterium]